MIVTTRHDTSEMATIPIGTASSDSVTSSKPAAMFSVAKNKTKIQKYADNFAVLRHFVKRTLAVDEGRLPLLQGVAVGCFDDANSLGVVRKRLPLSTLILDQALEVVVGAVDDKLPRRNRLTEDDCKSINSNMLP